MPTNYLFVKNDLMAFVFSNEYVICYINYTMKQRMKFLYLLGNKLLCMYARGNNTIMCHISQSHIISVSTLYEADSGIIT